MSPRIMFSFKSDYVLEDDYVMLRPLKTSDLGKLLVYACNEPELWRFSLISAAGVDNMRNYIAAAVKERKQGRQYAFIVYDKTTATYAGSTRFCDIDLETQCAQMGYTWYGKRFRGTPLNKHCKLLLLDFAFSKMNLERVEFRVDVENEIGRMALISLGCTQEGRLRACGPNRNGPRRDCYVYSILKPEWEYDLRFRLLDRLNHFRLIK